MPVSGWQQGGLRVVVIERPDRANAIDLETAEAGEADAINGVPGGFAGIPRRDFPKPVVAAVNGAAMGGGFEIVLACDFVVAAEHARFGLPEGDPIDARRALELGLVNRIAPEPVAAAVELAERLAAHDPRAVQAAKRIARTSLEEGEPAGWEVTVA
jgi:enoyl-CoA hydratase/carnithine racemase